MLISFFIIFHAFLICFSMQVDGLSRKRGRLKRAWIEVVKMDLKKCNISKDLAQDRPEQRNIIHIVDPHIVGTRL